MCNLAMITDVLGLSFVPVRIRGCGQAKFKGFMIQPRSALYPDRPAFLGAFLRVRGTRYECVRTGVSVHAFIPNCDVRF